MKYIYKLILISFIFTVLFQLGVKVYFANINSLEHTYGDNIPEELNLVIIWEKSRNKEEKIIKDLQKKHTILECIDIEWTKENAANNYLRFYEFSPKSEKFKEQECGTGNFLLITVLDKNPKYGYAKTTVGMEYVNTNMLILKSLYRKWTNGQFTVHTTINQKEVNHDIALLLGTNSKDYLDSVKAPWNGKIKHIKKDLNGYNGYNSLEEFFYTLNATTNYGILKNSIKNLNKTNKLVIFTDNYKNMHHILSPNPAIPNPTAQYSVRVGKDLLSIDVVNYKNSFICNKLSEYTMSKKYVENSVYTINNLFPLCIKHTY